MSRDLDKDRRKVVSKNISGLSRDYVLFMIYYWKYKICKMRFGIVIFLVVV